MSDDQIPENGLLYMLSECELPDIMTMRGVCKRWKVLIEEYLSGVDLKRFKMFLYPNGAYDKYDKYKKVDRITMAMLRTRIRSCEYNYPMHVTNVEGFQRLCKKRIDNNSWSIQEIQWRLHCLEDIQERIELLRKHIQSMKQTLREMKQARICFME